MPMSSGPSFPILTSVPARPEADPRSGVSFGPGFRPDTLHADLETEFRRRSMELAYAEPVTLVLDGASYEGLQMTAGNLRVAAAGVGSRLLVVSVLDWDGPLELTMVTPVGQQGP